MPPQGGTTGRTPVLWDWLDDTRT